jgi:hypothetical protein
MPNPWLSLWLSAANSWAGAARGFWTAELHRQQAAIANEMVRQMTEFWASTWAPLGWPGTEAAPPTGLRRPARPRSIKSRAARSHSQQKVARRRSGSRSRR